MSIHSNTQAALHMAQEVQKQFFNQKKGVPVDYCMGDWVWLKAKTHDRQPLVKTTQPMAKLDSKRFGPFKILETIRQAAY